jgi:hypothetical protein
MVERLIPTGQEELYYRMDQEELYYRMDQEELYYRMGPQWL